MDSVVKQEYRIFYHKYTLRLAVHDSKADIDVLNFTGKKIAGNCGDEDAQKFRGRGFKMLTGKANYAEYWVCRSWLKKNEFDSSWWLDKSYIKHDVMNMKLRAAIINDPHIISTIEYNRIDTGAYFTRGIKPDTMHEIDQDKEKIDLGKGPNNTGDEEIIKNVTLKINRGENAIESRKNFTRLAKRELI